MIHLKQFPMPPSVNNLYATSFTNKRRFKSRKYIEFEHEVQLWRARNDHFMNFWKQYIREGIGPFEVLEVSTNFFFPHKEIWTKLNKPKRNDTFNRLKALHDALSVILEVDDCYFWEGPTFKHAQPNEIKASVDIEISVVDRSPKSVSQSFDRIKIT